MSALSVEVPFPVFYDRSGEPLENGYVWIGQANLNPQTNPIQVYFDKNLTQPAAQPLRTLAGYISNAGTPAQVYVDADNFSILVQDKNGTMVYNFPDGTGISSNACGITYDPPFTGGVPYPVCEKLAQTVSVKDFGAVGDGVTDDTDAIKFALLTGQPVYFPEGVYIVSDMLEVQRGQQLIGAGCDRWDFPSHQGVIEQMGKGTTLLFTGSPTTTATVDLITEMSETGGVVQNPDATGPTDQTYRLLDFTNKNSVGSSTATPKALRVGLLLDEAHSAVVRDLRVMLSYNGISGYNDELLTGLGDDWDIGILVKNTSQYTIQRVQSVGYWRMAGGCLVNAKIGDALLAEGVFGRVESCYFQGYKGLSVRAPDVFRVTSVGVDYIDLPWSLSNPIQQSGKVWDGTVEKTYTSLTRVGDQVRLNGMNVSGINVGDEIRLNLPNVGVAGTVVQNSIVTGLFHKSRLAPWVLGFTSPGAALEISGFPLRDIDFINTHFFDSDVVVHSHNVEDMGFTGCFWEPYGYRTVPLGAFGLQGARFIVSPRAISGGFGPYSVNGTEKIVIDASSEINFSVDLYPYARNAAQVRFTSTTGLFRPFRVLNLGEGVGDGSAVLISSAIDSGTTIVTSGLPGAKRVRVVDPAFNILLTVDQSNTTTRAMSLATEKTNVTAPSTNDGNIYSGTYTPTLTNIINLDSTTASEGQYIRVGNVVTVSGSVNIDPTATGNTEFEMSLPIASNLTAARQCAGTFAAQSTATTQGGVIFGQTSNDTAVFRINSSSTANLSYSFHFTYRVL